MFLSFGPKEPDTCSAILCQPHLLKLFLRKKNRKKNSLKISSRVALGQVNAPLLDLPGLGSVRQQVTDAKHLRNGIQSRLEMVFSEVRGLLLIFEDGPQVIQVL